MKDLLQQASDWLEKKRTQFAARIFLYSRGNQTQNIPATVGKTVFEVEDGHGILLRHESRDFLVLAADLVLGNRKTLPQKGDRIHETQGEAVYVYEVTAPGKEPCWRYSDPYRKTLRIHTKQIAVYYGNHLLAFRAKTVRTLSLRAWTN
jgi:hypothetical protein